MNLRQLEAFRATMESGSITGAAELMHISQPSVSRLIMELERHVGFALFRRVGRGLVPTREAGRFHQAVDSMFVGVGRLAEIADSIRTSVSGMVSVGVIPSLSQAIVPDVVGELLLEQPDMRFMLSTRNTPAIVEAVRLQQFDLGLVSRTPPYAGVEVMFEIAVSYVCLVPSAHRLAQSASPLDLQALSDSERFITFGGAFPDAMWRMEPELSRKLQARSRVHATNMPMAAALTRTTADLSIVDPFSAALAEKAGGVVVRRLRQELSYHVAIITRGADTLSREGVILAEQLAQRLAAASQVAGDGSTN